MKKRKYGNKKCTEVINGKEEAFDSLMELERYQYLNLLQLNGDIKDLRRQVSLPSENAHLKVRGKSGRVLSYIADMVYYRRVEVSGVVYWEEVVEDVKGYRTPEFKQKWALAKALYPKLRFVCVTRKGKQWVETDW